MLNSMKEKTPVGVGDQCVELTLAERGVHALRLIGHITETLVIHTPEFRDQAVNRGLFSKEGDAGVTFKKGRDTFELLDYQATAEKTRLLLSVISVDGNGSKEMVMVSLAVLRHADGSLADGSIGYAKDFLINDNPVDIDTKAAVKGAEGILAKLKARGEPLIGSVT